MIIYKCSMRIYKCSMGFRIPAVDQSHWSIEYNYDLSCNMWYCRFSVQGVPGRNEDLHEETASYN